jgi:hypothetical protein
VCEQELDFLPWDGGIASHEICQSCGIHFGYNDARHDLREKVYQAWRDAWVANHRCPFTGESWRQVAEHAMKAVNLERGAG